MTNLCRAVTSRIVMLGLMNVIPGTVLAPGQELSRVRIRVVDLRGTPVGGARIEIKSCHNQFKRTLSKSDQVVPYGDYEITVSRDGYRTGRRRLTLESADTWVTVGLSSQASQLVRVEGKVRPSIDPVLPAWVRLISVYSDTILTQPVKESGEFTVVDVLPGKYLLVVLQEERKVLGLSEVTLSKSLETVVVPTFGNKRRPQ